MNTPQPVVACVSYFAAARLLRIRKYPPANYGTEVTHVDHAIAADGPMVAATLAAFGVPARLISNDIGTDPTGTQLRQTAHQCGIKLTSTNVPNHTTPEIVVLSDDDGNRTWFPHLPQATESICKALDRSDLTNLSLMYLDCYDIINEAATHAVEAASEANTPLFLNLGGEPLSPQLRLALQNDRTPVTCIQTNLAESHYDKAEELARQLATTTRAQHAVVTTGARGAVAYTNSQMLRADAYAVEARHLHGAGAAFSGGFIYGLLHDWNTQTILDFACACGSLRCEQPHTSPWPTAKEVQSFAANHDRLHQDV